MSCGGATDCQCMLDGSDWWDTVCAPIVQSVCICPEFQICLKFWTDADWCSEIDGINGHTHRLHRLYRTTNTHSRCIRTDYDLFRYTCAQFCIEYMYRIHFKVSCRNLFTTLFWLCSISQKAVWPSSVSVQHPGMVWNDQNLVINVLERMGRNTEKDRWHPNPC